MTVKLVRLPPIGNVKTERIKIVLEGNHTLEEKICMVMQAIAVLEHEHRIFRAGNCDLWLAPLDDHNHPLTFFADGEPIGQHKLIVNSPYSSAADHYRCG